MPHDPLPPMFAARTKVSTLVTLLLLGSLAACSSADPTASKAPSEPVTSAPQDGLDPLAPGEPEPGAADDPTGNPTTAPEDGVGGEVIDDPVDGAAVGGPSDGTPGPAAPETLPDPLTVDYPSAVLSLEQYAAGPLPALPNPPLTSAPDAADEPQPASGPRYTDAGFPLVEEREHLPIDPFRTISVEEFEAGPPPPVLSAPPDHDFEQNAAPFFAELEDVTLFAGELLELRLDPDDPDGGVAGQYTENLPDAANYIDNFDSTRTVVWRPLEPDVGIHEFHVYTVDPDEPALRVRYTVRVRVLEPSDPASIENRGPGIDKVEPQTVRVGDPVVIEIKGTDPNATIPSIELTNAPPAATLVVHREDPRIRILRFVPDTVGRLEIGVLARDAVDPSLTHEKTIEIDVRAAEDFTLEGTALRELADQRDFLIGYASASGFQRRPDGALYADIAAREFNVVTAENAMKMDAINPLPGIYRWAEADNLVAKARAAEQLIHGHALVWYAQLPAWVRASDPTLREGHMREHIDRVMTRYRDTVPVWDVVNEALEEDGSFRNSVWMEAMGPAHIDIAFRQARASAPDATLLYNDYHIGWAGTKADGLFRLLDSMKAADTPIDGVGFQMHVYASFDKFDEFEANIRRVAEMDLDVWITEFDVSMEGDDTEAEQAEVYERVLSICLAEPRCKAFQSWGYTDRYSWRFRKTPLPLDEEYRAKPAYRALQQRLGEN